MRVALVREVFFGKGADQRLLQALKQARAAGAALAVLPELPLNPWSPARRTPLDEDAEDRRGPRHGMLAAAAREAGIGVVGGAIVRDPRDASRHNTALVFDASGELVGSYAKLHLPEEPGFHETSHYEPGDSLPDVIRGFEMQLGVQICSDGWRPQGTWLAAARGAAVVALPRATEQATWPRWRIVLQANALVGCCFVLSVPRPRPEQGVLLGGAACAFGPDGSVLCEGEDALQVADLDPALLERAKQSYPGYLATRSDLYAEGWSGVPAARLPHS